MSERPNHLHTAVPPGYATYREAYTRLTDAAGWIAMGFSIILDRSDLPGLPEPADMEAWAPTNEDVGVGMAVLSGRYGVALAYAAVRDTGDDDDSLRSMAERMELDTNDPAEAARNAHTDMRVFTVVAAGKGVGPYADNPAAVTAGKLLLDCLRDQRAIPDELGALVASL